MNITERCRRPRTPPRSGQRELASPSAGVVGTNCCAVREDVGPRACLAGRQTETRRLRSKATEGTVTNYSILLQRNNNLVTSYNIAPFSRESKILG